MPKDGPSAGVTMITALVSLLTGRTVRAEVGMTGEVSLTGRVLPIGGVKQKLLAAQRAGLTEVFLPQRNEPDLDDVPADVLADVRVRIVSDVREILESALEPAHQRAPWRRPDEAARTLLDRVRSRRVRAVRSERSAGCLRGGRRRGRRHRSAHGRRSSRGRTGSGRRARRR